MVDYGRQIAAINWTLLCLPTPRFLGGDSMPAATYFGKQIRDEKSPSRSFKTFFPTSYGAGVVTIVYAA
jgi:hypothetical protein